MIDPRQMSVLIVDDMENMCKSIRSMLMVLKLGSKFFYAYNGLEAWKILKREEIDLAIVDWNMPVMTGVELLGRIRDDRNLRDMPIVMATAEANAEIVAEAAESDIDAYILKPLTVKSLGEKIAQVLEKANNPPPARSVLRSARALEESGDLVGAIETARKAMHLDPGTSRPIRELGYLYFKKGELGEAKKWFLQAVEINKNDVFAFHYLGEIYLKQDNIDKAAKYFNQAVQISPRHLSRSIEFGKILIQKGLVPKAEKVFSMAFEITEDPAALREELADFCIQNAAVGYAVKLMENIVAQHPTRHDILFKLGLASKRLGEMQTALSYFGRAETLDKENSEIKMQMAQTYLALDQKIRAEKMLMAVLDHDKNNSQARELLKSCL